MGSHLISNHYYIPNLFPLSEVIQTLTPILQMSRGDKNRLSDCCLRSSTQREELGTGECLLRSCVCDKSCNPPHLEFSGLDLWLTTTGRQVLCN